MPRTRWPDIWMYHSVAEYDADPHRITVTPRRFTAQMRWLHTRGLRGVSMAELLDARRGASATGLVGLTFDDGYADFLHEAVPLLARYSFTATVYVLSGRLGGRNEWDRPGPMKRLMDADELRHAGAAGMEIGSHGVAHASLPAESEATLRDELERSRRELSDLMRSPITGFAYPYGHLGDREIDAVRAAGYEHAVATHPGSRAGRLALPRTFVGERDRGLRLRAKQVRRRLREPRGEAMPV